MVKRYDPKPLIAFDAALRLSSRPIFSIYRESNHQFVPEVERLL
jgi:hypothetical protein